MPEKYTKVREQELELALCLSVTKDVLLNSTEPADSINPEVRRIFVSQKFIDKSHVKVLN